MNDYTENTYGSGLKYHARCCICGIALTVENLRASFEGIYADYKMRDGGAMRVNFCDEHWEQINNVIDEDFQKTVEKTERLYKDL